MPLRSPSATILRAMLPRRRDALPLLVGLGLVLLHALRFVDVEHAVDDAWISFRVARNLLEHGVLTYAPSRAPVEGATNLTWTLLSTTWIAALPGVDPILPARIAGLACHLLAVGIGICTAARVVDRAGGDGAKASLAAAIALGAPGSLTYWAMSGLETGLWGLLLAAGVALLISRRHLLAGLCLATLAATRPEGVLAGGLLCLGALAFQGRAALSTAVVFGAGVAALEGFRLVVYGDWVPNTFHAKEPSVEAGLDYVLGALGPSGIGLLGLPAGLAAARRRPAAALLLLACVLVAGAAGSGGDWMPGYRRLTLPLLLMGGLAGVGVGLAAGRPQRLLAWGGIVGAAACALLAGASRLDHGRFPHGVHAVLGERALETPGVQGIAAVDIGRLGWAFPGEVVDLVGLTDAHLARLPGSHADKPWDEQWFRGHDPDLLIVRSETPVVDPLPGPLVLGRPEQGMVRSVLDNGGYHLHTVLHPADGQWLLIFVKDGLALDLALWGPRAPKDLRQLLIEARLGAGGSP